VETSWKKFARFFQHAHSISRFLWCTCVSAKATFPNSEISFFPFLRVFAGTYIHVPSLHFTYSVRQKCFPLFANASRKRFYGSPKGLPEGTYIFKPKIKFWANFEVSCNERCW
jgi:hypothetical protein